MKNLACCSRRRRVGGSSARSLSSGLTSGRRRPSRPWPPPCSPRARSVKLATATHCPHHKKVTLGLRAVLTLHPHMAGRLSSPASASLPPDDLASAMDTTPPGALAPALTAVRCPHRDHALPPRRPCALSHYGRVGARAATPPDSFVARAPFHFFMSAGQSCQETELRLINKDKWHGETRSSGS